MLYLRSWLADYIDLKDYSDDDLKHLITMKSGEVEEIRKVTDYFAGKVVIGKIENLRKHPDADRLKIFDVDLGAKGKLQIVSAAPNSRDGLIVGVATIGAHLPMGTILERSMRGQKSEGMCVGKSELLLEDGYSSGLWELGELIAQKGLKEAEILGESICSIFPEYFPEDSIFDIKYLADKISACGNHLGLSLEIATCLERPGLLTQKALQLLDPAYLAEIILQYVDLDSHNLPLKFKDKSSYSNTFFLFDLKLQQHFNLPGQIQNRMFLTEKNLIGGVADLSNYLLYDIGQPTHFFSKDKVLSLSKNQTTLDWEIHKLTESEHFEGLGQLKSVAIPVGVDVLKQDQNILTIPAISGSNSTKTDENDKDIIVEIANFPAQNVASSSFKLNYRSEGARIWAGQVKICLQFILLARLVEILRDINQNQNIFNLSVVLEYIRPELQKAFGIEPTENLLQKATRIFDYYMNCKIKVDLDYLAYRLDNQGLNYWQTVLEQKLDVLGKYENDYFYPNMFYQHIESQEDILEQVARLIGYDSLAREHLNSDTHNILDKSFDKLNELKKVFADFGFFEIITRPFTQQEHTQKNHPALELLNPANSSDPWIRSNLYSSLLETTSRNIFTGEKDIRLFEFTKVYKLLEDKSLEENPLIEAVLVNSDPYILTSLINELSHKLGISEYKITDLDNDDSTLGHGYKYQLGDLEVKLIKISNPEKRNFDIPLSKDVWYLSLSLENWNKNFSNYLPYFNESEFPIISRQYSYIVDRADQWQKIEKLIKKHSLEEVEIRIHPLERFTSENKEKDIINYRVDFVSYTKNMEGSTIDEWEKDILKSSKGILESRG